jgi:N-acetyl-gamma-glutamylphosphate reductase
MILTYRIACMSTYDMSVRAAIGTCRVQAMQASTDKQFLANGWSGFSSGGIECCDDVQQKMLDPIPEYEVQRPHRRCREVPRTPSLTPESDSGRLGLTGNVGLFAGTSCNSREACLRRET